MAASIAVRLALLLHMSDSNIRWLFLDEPTANMDDKRRDKLADRITRLDQLDQIFVITHDDAFDRDTHHLIQISKLNGVSTATSIR
jgi:exonuclease SbcC